MKTTSNASSENAPIDADTKKTNGQTPPQIGNEEKHPEFAIQRIYSKDLSFETPHSPRIFQENWQPHVDIQINAITEKLSENIFEVKLAITVTTKLDDKVAFLAEVQQAGIFNIANFPDDQLHRMLGSYCPNILFPFARELIADLIEF